MAAPQAPARPDPAEPVGRPVEAVAHRGFSGRHLEMTPAAYLAAIDLVRRSGRELFLECDTHFSLDGHLVLMHDLTLERIAGRPDAAAELTLAELSAVDLSGEGRGAPEERRLMALPELFDLVAAARLEGLPVRLAVETKHPNPRGLEVDRGVLDLLSDYGWRGPDSPVRLISFNLASVELFVAEAPQVPRTLLIETELGPWADGHLPEGVDTAGVDHRLARPDFVDALAARGHHLNVWTVNDPADMAFWLGRGASGITTDHPDRLLDVMGELGRV